MSATGSVRFSFATTRSASRRATTDSHDSAPSGLRRVCTCWTSVSRVVCTTSCALSADSRYPRQMWSSHGVTVRTRSFIAVLSPAVYRATASPTLPLNVLARSSFVRPISSVISGAVRSQTGNRPK